MKHILLTCILLFFFRLSIIHAQATYSWEQYYEQITGDEEETMPAKEDIYDLLCQLEDRPFNINTATREQLQQLPFLSDQQIEDISYYLYIHGPMVTKAELMVIRSLDYYRRKLLECFVYVAEPDKDDTPPVKNILKYGKHQWVGMVKVPFYERKGDKSGYYGYPYKHYLKYDFHYGDYVKAGFVASQDAGEPFFADKNNWGYDYYSYYFLLRNWGRMKAFALGKYRISWGLGLVINNDFNLGKLISLSTLGRVSPGIKAHSSLSDYNNMQGIATTVALGKHLDLSAFFSYRSIDATLNKEDLSIATILKTGYHRTKSELQRKANSQQMTSGVRLSYANGGLRLGVNGLYTWLNRDLKPNIQQYYRRYYPQGNHFTNASIDYSYVHYRWSVKGETAVNANLNTATLNIVGFQLSSSLTTMLLHRFYSYKYSSLFASSFSSGGSVQNESGVYLGVNYNPSTSFSLMAYVDMAYFPWKRYQSSASSHAYDNLIQLTWRKNNWTASARYQLKMREKDNKKKTRLVYDTTHRGRVWIKYENTSFSNRFQLDGVLSRYKQQSMGWMLTNNTSLVCGKNLKAGVTMGYFHTDDYSARIYAYEPGLLYTLSYGMYYGKGLHGAINLRCAFGKRVLVIAKMTTTKYYDRDKISSGLSEIARSSMSDLQLQMKLTL